MLEPFIGEIQILPYDFAPRGWALCNGQLLPIAQYTALFSILGTTYGGNGRNTFALPDLQGRVPIAAGTGPGLTDRVLGEMGGAETVQLTQMEMPAHTHALTASSERADSTVPADNFLATDGITFYADAMNLTPMSPAALLTAGGGQEHNNLQPYLTMNFYIALEGIFPSRG